MRRVRKTTIVAVLSYAEGEPRYKVIFDHTNEVYGNNLMVLMEDIFCAITDTKKEDLYGRLIWE